MERTKLTAAVVALVSLFGLAGCEQRPADTAGTGQGMDQGTERGGGGAGGATAPDNTTGGAPSSAPGGGMGESGGAAGGTESR